MSEDKKFLVGYGRTNITPTEPMPLDSYGNATKRIHETVANEILFTAIAMTDENDRTLLLMTYDITQANWGIYAELQEYATEKYGVEPRYVHLSGTHTHSSVALWVEWDSVARYKEMLLLRGKEAIDEAMADRKPAKMFFGTTKTERMNFVRHYFRADGTTCGDNHGSWSTAPVVSHVKEPDESMRVLKFTRENADGSAAKDLVIVNWQAHNHLTGGSKRYELAADFSGAMRTFLEEDHDCFCTFFQGCAGDLNEKDNRLPQNNRTEDLFEYGRILADYVNGVYDRMEPLKTGPIKAVRNVFNAAINHTTDNLRDAAAKIHKDWIDSGFDTKAAVKAGEPYNIHSPYQAGAILRRFDMGAELETFVNAYAIGELGFTSVPMEMFCETGKHIREASPFKLTITQGYTDNNFGYLPTKDAYEYGCYEADSTIWAPGNAELIEEKLIGMLKELHDGKTEA